MAKLLLCLLASCITMSGYCQTPQLDIDINNGIPGSDPNFLTPFGSKLYLCADDGNMGHEPYMYDGKNAPTLLMDISYGTGHSTLIYTTATGETMAKLGSKIYFAAGVTASNIELYSYDTTSGAVTQEVELIPGSTGSYPFNLVAIGNRIYFNANSVANGNELYSYDGVNPPVLYDINTGPLSSSPGRCVPLNGKIYFKANDSAHGAELFMLDPVTGIYGVAADIRQGIASSSPNSLTAIGNKLYFAAGASGFNSIELYSFDGAITARLTHFTTNGAGGISGSYAGFPVYKGYIYFTGSGNNAAAQLYKYSIDSGTTALAYDVYPNYYPDIREYMVYNNDLYFTFTSPSGNELWKYNGTTCGMVADLAPGPASSTPTSLTIWNGSLYFSATDSTKGRELYKLTTKLSIQREDFKGVVSLYPNPVYKDLNLAISLPSPMLLDFNLIDVAGKVIYTSGVKMYSTGTGKSIIPVSSLSAGQYFYQIQDEHGKTLVSGSVQVNH